MGNTKDHVVRFVARITATALAASLVLGALSGCSAAGGEGTWAFSDLLQVGDTGQAYGLEGSEGNRQEGADPETLSDAASNDASDQAPAESDVVAPHEESLADQGASDAGGSTFSRGDPSSEELSLLSTSGSSFPTATMSWAGHTYAVYDDEISWAEAKAYCESMGGHLVAITSQTEQNFVYGSLLAGLWYPYWIGLTYESGSWQWVTGEAYGGYRNFALDENRALTNVRGNIYTQDGVINRIQNGVVVEQFFVPAGQWGWWTDDGYNNLTGFICEWDNLASIPRMDTGENESPDSESLWADPVDLATGAMKIDLSYLDQSANIDFAFDLTYDGSRLVGGDMGAGWHHNYEKKIVSQGDKLHYYSDPSTYVEFSSDDGSNVYRTSTPGKQNWTLTRNSNGSYYLNCGFSQYLSFSSDGQLTRIANRVGDCLEVTRSGDTTTVRDPFAGKSLVLSRNDAGLLERIESKSDGVTSGSVFFEYSAGQLAITDPNGFETCYRHDDKGRITQILGADGAQVALNTYDGQGRIVEQDDGLDDGNVTRFAYGVSEADDAVYTIVTDRAGEESRATFDPKTRRLLSFVDREQHEKSYVYDEQGNLLGETDENGNATTYAYNANNDLLSKTDATGATTTYAYDERSNMTSVTDPDGATTTNMFDAHSRLTSTTSPNGTVTAFEYADPSGGHELASKTIFAGGDSRLYSYTYAKRLKTSETDALGNTTTHTYDAFGRLASTTDALGNTTSTVYDALGNVLFEIDAEGGSQAYVYDWNGNLLSETDEGGNTTAYAYNGNGKLTSKTDALGNTTAYAYDAEDRLVEVVDPSGNVTQRGYDREGRLIQSLDALGNATTYTYDAAGNLLRERTPQASTTEYAYDAAGRVTSRTGGGTGATTYAYTSAGRLASATDARRFTTTYTYDALGNLASVTDANGNTTSYAYDGNGKLAAMTDANGNTTTYAYDANLNRVSATDATGVETTYAYDAAENLVSRTNVERGETSYAYDGNARLTSATDGSFKTYRQTYSATGDVAFVHRPSSAADPLIAYAAYTYDALGRQASSLNAAGQRHAYAYDAAGNLTQDAGPLSTRTYDYDAAGRLTGFSDAEGATSFSYDGDGNLTGASDAQGTLQRYYDQAGRVISAVDARGNATDYAYDAAGNLVMITYPDGRRVGYIYDAVGNMSSVIDWAGRTTMYGYDAVSNLTSVSRPDGSSQTYTYDRANRVTEMYDRASDGTVIERCQYVYDGQGCLRAESSSANASMTFYTYGSLGRIASTDERSTSGSQVVKTYGYDAYGNITSAPRRPVSTKPEDPVLTSLGGLPVDFDSNIRAAYDGRNRLMAFDGRAVTHDAEGNMTSGPLQQGSASSLSYDSGNRLVGVDSTSYAYDALDNRISKSDASGATTYAYDASSGSNNLLASTDAHGNTTSYVWGMGLVASEGADGAYLVHHYDMRGSTTALTDASGAVVGRYSYDLYGQVASHTGSAATPFLYCGQYGVADDGGGLLFMRARYYSPYLMRFVSADALVGSVSDPATLNRYAYALGNPIIYVDPFGRSAVLASGGHAALDVAGFIPVAGALFDVANGVWYAVEGDWSMAGLSMLGAVPVAGDAASGAKIGAKAISGAADAISAAGKGAKAEKAVRSTREVLLGSVENPKLKNAIDEIYRPGAAIGDGGLADAVRHELSTGELVGGKSHIQKATERVTNLERIIEKQDLNERDLEIANNLLKDLKAALGGR